MMADDARDVVKKAGLDPRSWTPRELRHSFVSLLSEDGVPLEDLSRLVGHSSTVVTETVYRKELRPVLTRGAEAMVIVFRTEPVDRQSVTAVHGASGAYQPWGVARNRHARLQTRP
jgi:site-specific recombinase XerD